MESLLANSNVSKICLSLLFALHFVVFVQLIQKQQQEMFRYLLLFVSLDSQVGTALDFNI